MHDALGEETYLNPSFHLHPLLGRTCSEPMIYVAFMEKT